MNLYPTISPSSLPPSLDAPYPFPLQSHFHIYDSPHFLNFPLPPSIPALSLTLGSKEMGLNFDFPSMLNVFQIQLHYSPDCSSEMHIGNTHSTKSPLHVLAPHENVMPPLSSPSSLLLPLTPSLNDMQTSALTSGSVVSG